MPKSPDSRQRALNLYDLGLVMCPDSDPDHNNSSLVSKCNLEHPYECAPSIKIEANSA